MDPIIQVNPNKDVAKPTTYAAWGKDPSAFRRGLHGSLRSLSRLFGRRSRKRIERSTECSAQTQLTYLQFLKLRIRLVRADLPDDVAAYVIRSGTFFNQADALIIGAVDEQSVGAVCELALMLLACSQMAVITIPLAPFQPETRLARRLHGESSPLLEFGMRLQGREWQRPLSDRLKRACEMEAHQEDVRVLQGYDPRRWDGPGRYAALRHLLGTIGEDLRVPYVLESVLQDHAHRSSCRNGTLIESYGWRSPQCLTLLLMELFSEGSLWWPDDIQIVDQ